MTEKKSKVMIKAMIKNDVSKTKKEGKNKNRKIFQTKIDEVKKVSEPLYKIPQATQELIEISKISKSGIFEVNGIYSKTYSFTDINYENEPDEEQIVKFNRYCKLLDCIGAKFKVTLLNQKMDKEQTKEQLFYKYKEDKFNQLRDCYNEEMENIIDENQGIELCMLITVSVERSDFEEAKAFFITLEATLVKKFKEMGSKLTPLTGNERLNLIRSLYQMNQDYTLPVEIKDYINGYGDFLNDIAASHFKYDNANVFVLNGKYCQAVYISRYSNSVSDRLLKKICSIGTSSIISIDYIPIQRDIGKKYVENKLMGIESSIDRQQKKRNKNLAFSSEVSRKILKEKEDIEEILDDVDMRDQNMFFVGTNIIVFADTKEDLYNRVENIKRNIADESCRADTVMFKMKEAFTTALPLGVRQTTNEKFLVTRSAAALFPFTVQELFDKGPGSLWYGKNFISKNIVYANKKKLGNGNSFVFGLPGFGKSVSMKMEMLSVFLETDDDIIVLDPTLEYKNLISIMNGAYIEFTNNTKSYINPLKVKLDELDFSDLSGEIGRKTEFMEGLCEKALGKKLDPITVSVIDDAVEAVYFEQIKEKKEEITLSDFVLQVQNNPRPEAETLVYSMKKYTTGSLNIFNHMQNVNINSRVTGFGTRDLGETLSPMAMMITLIEIKNKVLKNYKKNKATWVYVDEFYNCLGSEYVENFFIQLIKQIRKFGGLVCCATQNVADTLKSRRVRSMVDNSEYILMFKQSVGAIPELVETITGMKDTYEDFLLKAEHGQGMLKFGNTIFPVSMELNREGSLYKLFNTNLHEIAGTIDRE